MSETSMTASDEDREALARALHDASEIGGVTPPWDREQPEGRQHWLALADAALAWFASRSQAAPSVSREQVDRAAQDLMGRPSVWDLLNESGKDRQREHVVTVLTALGIEVRDGE